MKVLRFIAKLVFWLLFALTVYFTVGVTVGDIRWIVMNPSAINSYNHQIRTLAIIGKIITFILLIRGSLFINEYFKTKEKKSLSGGILTFIISGTLLLLSLLIVSLFGFWI